MLAMHSQLRIAAFCMRAFTMGIHLIGIDLEVDLHVEGTTRALCDLRGS